MSALTVGQKWHCMGGEIVIIEELNKSGFICGLIDVKGNLSDMKFCGEQNALTEFLLSQKATLMYDN
jgi:hypothetical protein